MRGCLGPWDLIWANGKQDEVSIEVFTSERRIQCISLYIYNIYIHINYNIINYIYICHLMIF